MGRSRWSGVFALACLLFVPAVASAQASITGVVKDGTGAILPGVTVEASSPALIEKVRSVVADGTGQYRIVDLRPGTYSLTFSLQGFQTFKREGIELSGSAIVTVDAELKVGAVAETVTVTSEAPVVDVQTTAQQRVMGKDVIDSLPVGRGQADLAVLVPGMTSGGQDVGGQGTLSLSALAIHGGRGTDQRQSVDGMTIRNVAGQGNSSNFIPDVGATQELTIDYSGGSAEAITSGVLFNFIPREGGNKYQGTFFGTATNSSFQGTNLTSDLLAQGLKAPNHLESLHDINPSFGGPLVKDRLWFYSSARWQTNRTYVAGMYDNLNAGNPAAWSYSPDLSHQSVTWLSDNTGNTRLTWQASPKNKFTFFYENQWRNWEFITATITPESAQQYSFPRLDTGTVGWSSPRTDRLLLEAHFGIHHEDIRNYWPTDANDPFRTLIGVTEQGGTIPGLRYRGRANTNDTSIAANDSVTENVYEAKASLTYVTGSHAFKLGLSDDWGKQTYYSYDIPCECAFRFLNGVPNQITERQNLYAGLRGGINAELGLFAQDKWTIKRFTLTPGIRYDYVNTGWDAYTFGPVPNVPNRNISFPDQTWYHFNDVSLRLGGTYDVFGNQKTAIKVNVGRYPSAIDPTQGNPAAYQLVNRVTRSWTDRTPVGSANYYVPNCDLLNPLANGDCGTISDLRFGTAVPSTVYNSAILGGWNTRPYNWELSARVQQQLLQKLAVDVGYFRRIFGGFIATDNLAVTPGDFGQFSVTTPVDPRLPNGGGYVVSGLYNVNPNKFGQVSNYVTSADAFGGQTEHYDGIDVNMTWRYLSSGLLQGGVSTGRVTQDDCAIVTAHPEVTVVSTVGSVQSTTMCHVVTPFQPNVKFLATYTVPKIDVGLSGTFQSLPGPLFAANYVVSTAQVQPSLGRPLAGGAANTTVNILAPGTMYGERLNQLDLRFTKALKFNQYRVRVNLDAYNAFNGNYVRAVNATYSTKSWLTPTSVLDPRLFKISAQFDF
ncbi:MAG TPA: carboxypeptidase regulatory-like domain-containing protein [Vicinamibacterales bacterium]|nr:carboxypeptidase regulatory-like domain-containing protein [Vicinamibacterales bacterium]